MRMDFHCHIIPSVDDGAKTIEDSIEMLKIAEEDGTDIICATPHYYTYYYENCFKDIKKEVDKLNKKAEDLNLKVRVVPGQEIFLDCHILDNYKKGIINTIYEKRCILLELPFESVPKYALNKIYELKILNLNIIIAHPERYIQFCSDVNIVNEFIGEGCLFQINSGSILGENGSKVKKNAEFLLKNGLCDFIGSDAHNTYTRAPRIKEALYYVKRKYPEVYKRVDENSKKALNGEIIHSEHEKVRKKRTFFWKKK